MKKAFRFFLPLLILLGMTAAFYLETKSQLSSSGHVLVQILIVAATCWLALNWVSYDEMSSLREFHKSEPVRFHYRISSPIEDAEIVQNVLTGQRLNGAAQAITSKSQNAFRGVSIITSLKKQKRKTIDIHVSSARVTHALMSVGIVFALTVVMLLIGSKTLGEGVITILYLIPIGWCTVRWGQLAGVSAALTAALSFDYLFIPPYGTFNIGSTEGWLLLFLFVATAILIVGRIQSILTEERERERKATFLYEVVAAISSQATREGVAQAIANQILAKFLAKGVQIHFAGGWGYRSLTAHAEPVQATAPSGKPDRVLAIVSGTVRMGKIDIWQGTIPLPSEDDLMLQTMLKQIAAALERVRVAEGKAPFPQQKPSYPDGSSLQTSQS